jgi:DNA-binding CsgD family transcriptional regulator
VTTARPLATKPTSRDRRSALELADALRRCEPDVSARELMAGPVAALLRANRGGSYSLTAETDRLRVSVAHAVGLSVNAYARDFEGQLATGPQRYVFYDPSRPEPAQRNAVVQLGPSEYTASGRALYARHGLAECWQLRVLVCDGPSLLAWVGALREGPFTTRERFLLRALVPALRHRLLLERQLGDAALSLSALPAVLEAAGTPALLLSGVGAVVLANASARSLLERGRRDLLALLRAELAGTGPGRFAITPLAVPGCPTYLLAVQRPEPEDPRSLAAAFAARYGLTARQAEVVALAARGLANKTIAAHLRCAESTVEMHLTAVFARTQVESRAALVAQFWKGAGR